MTLAMVAAFAVPAVAWAADIEVTTTVDELDVNGSCSLREAVIAANTNTAVDACPAGEASDGDRILLAAAATYELGIPGADEDAAATGDLDVLGDTRIAQDFRSEFEISMPVIDANGIDRVFDIHGAEVDLGLTNVVITGGVTDGDGGGILLRGDGSDGTTPCTTSARVTSISANLVLDNTAARGGGIFIGPCGLLDAELLSVADNTALEDGGGIALGANSFMVFNSGTISGNAANRGGGVWSESRPNGGIYWSTVSENVAAIAGGVWAGPSDVPGFNIDSTIVTNNAVDDCVLADGAVIVAYTLASDTSCGEGAGNLPSTDPLLLPRDDGPIAYKLAPGSPAIDAGRPGQRCGGTFLSDQYGTARPNDGNGDGLVRCDIGSYEAPEVPMDDGAGHLPDTALALTADPLAWVGPVAAIATAVLVRRRRVGRGSRPTRMI
jgi:CSLREA domain-containing protein